MSFLLLLGGKTVTGGFGVPVFLCPFVCFCTHNERTRYCQYSHRMDYLLACVILETIPGVSLFISHTFSTNK
jgi:hypothetical protein